MNKINIANTLKDVAGRYIPEQIKRQTRDVPRYTFIIDLFMEANKQKKLSELEIMDIGGGPSLFSVGCAAIGMKRSVLVDDFDDAVNHCFGQSILEVHRSYGVEIFSRDAVKEGIRDINGYFDVITSFDSMEHWHNSPKKLFHEVVEKLRPGGVFILAAPNCVSLRKRITVPFGYGRWSNMEDWYETQIFRGHVREPSISDFKYILNDLGLKDTRIFGRNFMVTATLGDILGISGTLGGTLLHKIDYPLRLFPSLCSDLYMIGRKAS